MEAGQMKGRKVAGVFCCLILCLTACFSRNNALQARLEGKWINATDDIGILKLNDDGTGYMIRHEEFKPENNRPVRFKWRVYEPNFFEVDWPCIDYIETHKYTFSVSPTNDRLQFSKRLTFINSSSFRRDK